MLQDISPEACCILLVDDSLEKDPPEAWVLLAAVAVAAAVSEAVAVVAAAAAFACCEHCYAHASEVRQELQPLLVMVEPLARVRFGHRTRWVGPPGSTDLGSCFPLPERPPF